MQGVAEITELAVLKSRVDELATVVASRDRKIADQQRTIDHLTRMLFDRKSEKVDPNQLKLYFAEMADSASAGITEPFAEEAPDVESTSSQETAAQTGPAKKKGAHGRRKLPENLPVEETHIHPPEAERVCAKTGQPMREIGTEVTEQLDYKPAQFTVLRTVRHKYACGDTCLCGVLSPALPEAPIHKGMPGAGLLAHVVVSKYGDHLPLHRLSAIFSRSGIDISKSTMCGWVEAAADLAAPIVDAEKWSILHSRNAQTDGTGIRVLDKNAPGGSRKAAIWVYASRDHDVVFEYSSRSRDGPRRFFENFEGYLQADAEPCLDQLFESGKIVEVGCFAHARRYFFKALDSDPEPASRVMAIVRLLYIIEAKAKESRLPPDEVRKLRQEKSVPLLSHLKSVLDSLAVKTPPRSPLGKAVKYALKHWDALNRYTEDGRLDIDNNASERRIRTVAIGRKNWLFAGSDDGARRGAILYSIIATCKENGVEPFEYLRDVFSRLPTWPKDRIAELTPRAWKASRLIPTGPAPTPGAAIAAAV